MSDVVLLLVAALVAYVPGLAVLAALRVGSPVVAVAVAPPLTVATCGLTAVAAAVGGFGYGPVPVLVVVVLLLVVAGLRGYRARRRRLASLSWKHTPPPAERRRDRTEAVPVAVGLAMTVVALGYGLWGWLRGLAGLATVPQEHDMIIHAMQTAYIARSGRAAPWELVPADVLTGGPVSFYPSGFHLLAGLTAQLDGLEVVRALNAMTVVVLVGTMISGTAALAVVAARRVGLGRGAAMLAAGVAALVIAGMYRPVYQLTHDGGILGQAAAFAMVPGAVAALVALPGRRMAYGVAAGIATAGAVWVHPSVAVSISLTTFFWGVGELLTRYGRQRLRGLLKPLAVAVGAAAVLLVPAVGPGLGATGRTGAFPPDSGPVDFGTALERVLALPYTGWLDPDNLAYQRSAAILAGIGVVALLVRWRGLGPVVAWLFWVVILIGAWLSPGTGYDAIVTGFFYNAMLRTWSHTSMLVPVLAGLGVVLVGALLARIASRLPGWAVVTAVAAGVFTLYAVEPARNYATMNEEAVATRYSTPDFVRVGPDDQAAIAWLADRVRPGERVFNSPNDGSTYLYVERGVPVVNVYTLGLPGVPYSYELLEHFNTYPTDPAVRRQLEDLDVAWVYVDESAPGIGSNGSPDGWAGSAGFSLAPGLADLDGLPGLDLRFRSGTVSVYSLDLGRAVPTA
ncbi:DUF6541 family protein [Pseudonocardia oroxyli]|uniref:Dolichyl-phosphate-mannose-protein mannosyltransferase n=1 Tax=Pseudonocardia oroxyli TaxID=366584 RepID=A0A1G7M4K2_PSEOR|nr:DUF6541 family protein [Pseudonocardia oroxyli]SDF56722.1 hypothetical protein SAMN05216377_105261 [Pseudonocardia oroxyli]